MFRFKQFSIDDSMSAMKIGTDGVLAGAWAFSDYTPVNILDVGCGSGLISLMLAQRFPHATITGVEIDPAAASQARANVDASPWADRITIVNADFCDYTPGSKVDAIVSNPPFFNQPLCSPDSRRALARHEAGLTLDTLLDRSAQLLTDNGQLAFIAPVEQCDRLVYSAATRHLDCCRITNVFPAVKREAFRVLLECRKGLSNTFSTGKLYIRDSSNQRYSDEYRNLTEAFYLDSTFA